MVIKTVRLILICILTIVFLGCEGGAENSSSSTNTSEITNQSDKIEHNSNSQATNPKPQIKSLPLRIWFDYSGSQNDELFAKYVDEIVNNIARSRSRISGVEVVYFSHGNRSISDEVAEKFIWGDAPEVKEFQPNMETATSDQKMFKEARDKFIDDQRDSFNKTNEKNQSEYNSLVENKLKDLKVYLTQKSQVKAPCTRFMSLATRIKTENLPYNLVITDGWADCIDETEKTITAVELDGKNVIVQLTSTFQVNDNEIKKREHFLKTLFPTANIFPIYMSNQAIDNLFR